MQPTLLTKLSSNDFYTLIEDQFGTHYTNRFRKLVTLVSGSTEAPRFAIYQIIKTLRSLEDRGTIAEGYADHASYNLRCVMVS